MEIYQQRLIEVNGGHIEITRKYGLYPNTHCHNMSNRDSGGMRTLKIRTIFYPQISIEAKSFWDI
jgi:hypothetical protein